MEIEEDFKNEKGREDNRRNISWRKNKKEINDMSGRIYRWDEMGEVDRRNGWNNREWRKEFLGYERFSGKEKVDRKYGNEEGKEIEKLSVNKDSR